MLPAATAAELAQRWAGADGVLVAGAGVDDVDAVLELGARLGWPVLADPRSGCRVVHPAVVAHADALLRVPAVADALRPSFVVRLGQPPASKVLATWLAASGAVSRCWSRRVGPGSTPDATPPRSSPSPSAPSPAA